MLRRRAWSQTVRLSALPVHQPRCTAVIHDHDHAVRRSAALRALLQDVVTVTDDGGGEPGGIDNTRVHGYLVRAGPDATPLLIMTSWWWT